MRAIALWAAAILLGAVLGIGSAWATLEVWGSSFSEKVGAWSYNSAAGSRAAGPYTRAIIARVGLLALNTSEARYFNLDRDEHGRPLSESCIYELSGRAPPARWWSVTLYAPDNYLALNDDHAASVDASTIAVGRDGFWRARISPVRGDALDWISSRAARRGFSLTLRLYNTDQMYRPSTDDLPALTTLSCPDGAS